MTDYQGLVMAEGEGKVVTLLGNRIAIKVSGEQTDGRCAVLLYTVTPENPGPPLHRHEFDEVFHVIDGALTFRIDEEILRAEAGTTVFAPGGVPHTYSNPGSIPATYLLTISPAGCEQYFLDLAALVAEGGRPDPEVLRELGRRYGIEPVALMDGGTA